MTDKELKKKIEDILEEYNFETDYGWILDTEEMADALIVANIGDVSEYKYRAEVAENALMNAVKIILYNCGANPNNTDYFYKRFLQESKKELQ